MMILPIKSVREEDKPALGSDLFNLAYLHHLGFPIPNGVVITPPEIKLKTLLEKYSFKNKQGFSSNKQGFSSNKQGFSSNKEVFEQSLSFARSEILTIETPLELKKLAQSKKIDSPKLWLALLEVWINQIRSKLWREGFSKDLTRNLPAQSLFFTGRILASCKAFYDPRQSTVLITNIHGKISIEDEVKIEELVRKANKRLLIPQVYDLLIEGTLKKIYIVRVSPFTPEYQTVPGKPMYQAVPSVTTGIKDFPPKALRVFLKAKNAQSAGENLDGLVLALSSESSFDEKILNLLDAAQALSEKPVIYKLPKTSQELIHDQVLLKKETEVILFARQKKSLLNVNVQIPLVRSPGEFLQIKRDLASFGVARKGSLKIWLEIGVPENIINLEDYLLGGIDGVVLNLDTLAGYLGGFDHSLPESIFYKKNTHALTLFLEDSLKLLHKSKVLFLAEGDLVLNDEVLNFLLGKGCFGIILSSPNMLGVSSYISFFEKRHIRAAA